MIQVKPVLASHALGSAGGAPPQPTRSSRSTIGQPCRAATAQRTPDREQRASGAMGRATTKSMRQAGGTQVRGGCFPFLSLPFLCFRSICISCTVSPTGGHLERGDHEQRRLRQPEQPADHLMIQSDRRQKWSRVTRSGACSRPTTDRQARSARRELLKADAQDLRAPPPSYVRRRRGDLFCPVPL